MNQNIKKNNSFGILQNSFQTIEKLLLKEILHKMLSHLLHFQKEINSFVQLLMMTQNPLCLVVLLILVKALQK